MTGVSDDTPKAPRVELAVRSYGADPGEHSHAFSQLVLPFAGTLDIDVGGREARLDASRAAFVEPGMRHSQVAKGANRSLIVDLDPALLPPELEDRFARSPFVALPPHVAKLVDFMRLAVDGGTARTSTSRLWLPLLLEAMSERGTRPHARLARVIADVEAAPEIPWTAAMMAERAALSVSRLHALFRAELQTTPRAWLAEVRLQRVREWLAHTNFSIAEIAWRAGFADQSALTRAMRRATGLTPAAYRRLISETGPKKR